MSTKDMDFIDDVLEDFLDAKERNKLYDFAQERKSKNITDATNSNKDWEDFWTNEDTDD
tara:strand:+ start:491 stop:667 length:177 start_codon:yes stop_codon:yes gene_type:complete